MTRRIATALLLAALVMPAVARAQDEGVGFFPLLHYGITGGGMIPAGQQGHDLRRGANFGGEVYGESPYGVQFGGEASYTASNDTRRTRISQVGLFSRLSPTPEDYRLYVQLGLGGYAVSYHAGAPRPASKFRPGGSFAMGGDFARWANVSLGGSLAYHGVLLERHHAIAYSTVRLHLTYQRLAL